nr:hypothetical protein CFP56_27787 [Quercus suber]POF20750.1 hypothetical protein CFP56_65278 [Quercus suber]
MEDNVAILLKARKLKSSTYIDTWPHYPEEVTRKPYPTNYTSLIFPKYDGMIGNAREHIRRYVDALTSNSNDRDLRLTKFSKSLEGRAFTWYTSLFPRKGRGYLRGYQTTPIEASRRTSMSVKKPSKGSTSQATSTPRQPGKQESKKVKVAMVKEPEKATKDKKRERNEEVENIASSSAAPVPLQDEEMTLRIQQVDKVCAFLEGMGLRPLARVVARS